MNTAQDRIQISAKVPKRFIEFLVHLDPFDRSNAVNIALEIAYKAKHEITIPKTVQERIAENSENAEIEAKTGEIDNELQSNTETNTHEIGKSLAEIEFEINNAHQKGYDLAKAELGISAKKAENIVEIDLTEMESEMAEYLGLYGFEHDRYLIPSEEKRIQAEFEGILEKELEKQKSEFDKIQQNQPNQLDHFPEFRACVIETIKGFAKYSNSRTEKWLNSYDELYITELYFTKNAKNLLI